MAAGGSHQYLPEMTSSRFAFLFITTAVTLSIPVFAGAAEPVAPAVDAIAADSARWTEIKDIPYDAKPTFFVGFKRLETRLDEQIGELTVRRAAMKSIANTKDWDFAMKELGNARSYLKGTGEVLGKATSDTWAQEKEKVGLAWVRAQAAVAKVRGSTTL
jgi:hypothetical protein